MRFDRGSEPISKERDTYLQHVPAWISSPSFCLEASSAFMNFALTRASSFWEIKRSVSPLGEFREIV